MADQEYPEVTYEQFRTGLTFKDVRELLWHEQQAVKDTGNYMFVSRGTVLGRWHEIKKSMWHRFQELRNHSLGDPSETGE